ncbi:hypothetical protein [Neobacillus mesonae]|uniref:hypothetical protein n=1 Tax=Neobacillus mesonae TaxID=1193713 RepID=UPI00203ABE03|nr:hypothetical protein [Neobacillus mesonae]MCM3569778.1 hypothetical protein [Neobacillus mesonae]
MVDGERLDCPQRRKMGRRGRWRESGLPAKEKKAQTRSKEVNWIARKGEKSADTVKGNELDCPQRRNISRRGPWRESGLPAKAKNESTRSMERVWIARKGEKSEVAVKGNELDYPQRRKKGSYGQWKRAGLPAKEKKVQTRSMKVSELDYPHRRKKRSHGQ